MKTGKNIENYLNVQFKSISENESLARLIISSLGFHLHFHRTSGFKLDYVL